MLSIILLRLQRLKGEYHVFLIMTVLSLVFSFIFGMTQSQDFTPTVLIVDMDESTYSQMVIDEFKNDNTFRYSVANYDAAATQVEDGKVLASIVIYEGFDTDIRNNNIPSIGVIKTKEDRDIFTLNSIVANITSKVIGNTNIAEIASIYVSELADADKDTLFDKAYNMAVEDWRYKKPVFIEASTLEQGAGFSDDNLTHSIIGFSLFFSMYTIVFAIGEILNDRKNNTWQRVLVSPISKISILGGHLVVTFLIGLVQVSVLFISGRYLFDINFGVNLGVILLILSAFVFTVTSLGLFLSGIVKTHSQLAAMTPIILTGTSMLGGCMWPLEIVNNKIVLALANITPQKWAIQAMESIAIHGKGLNEVVFPALVLTVMGLIFFGLGVKLVRFE